MKTNNVERDALIACLCILGVLASADASGAQRSSAEMSTGAEMNAATPVRSASVNPFIANQFTTPPLPMIVDTPGSLKRRIKKIDELHNSSVRKIPGLITHGRRKHSEPEEEIEHINASELRGMSLLDELSMKKLLEAGTADKKRNGSQIQRKRQLTISSSGDFAAYNLREMLEQCAERTKQPIDYVTLDDDDKFLLNIEDENSDDESDFEFVIIPDSNKAPDKQNIAGLIHQFQMMNLDVKEKRKSREWLEVSTLEVLSPEGMNSEKTTEETVLLTLYIPETCKIQDCAQALLELKEMADKLIKDEELELLDGWDITPDHIGRFLDVVDKQESIETITSGKIRAADIYECIPLITYWNKTIDINELLECY